MNLKHIILTLLASFFISIGFSQTKYDYAMINYNTYSKELSISLNGENYHEEKFDKNEIEGRYDINPVLEKINQMNDEGWEVFQPTSVLYGSGDIIFSFLLRREEQ